LRQTPELWGNDPVPRYVLDDVVIARTPGKVVVARNKGDETYGTHRFARETTQR